MSQQSPVLVVDDSSVDREQIRRLVGKRFDLIEATTAFEALEISSRRQFDCVLLDHRLPDQDGVDLVRGFVAEGSSVVMLTGCGNERVAVEAMKRGACDYLTKDDLRPELLRRTIQTAQERAIMRRQLARQSDQLQESMAALQAANEELRESELRVRMVLEQLPAIVWTTNEHLTYRHVAGSALSALHTEPQSLIGQPLGAASLAIHGCDRATEAHQRALLGEGTDYEVTTENGAVFSCHVHPWEGPLDGAPGVIGVAIDVTAERELDERLRRSQKLEAIGQLAGGVAHDFNNILTAIVSFATLAKEDLGDRHPVGADLQEIIEASERAAGLTRQLLTFARENRTSPVDLDLSSVVKTLRRMLRRLLTEDLDLSFALSPEPCPIHADASAIEQLLVNLVVNARDALEPGGKITVSVAPTQLCAPRTEDLDVDPGQYVCLTVADTGIGMTADVLEHIFEPFYSTKQDSGGTGLGLSTCYGIARDLGGTIEVVSQPGRGAQFSVFLPFRSTGHSVLESTPDEGPAPRGSETILIAEDQAPLRQAFERFLESLGYRVLVAADGARALELAHSHPGSIDLLLSDVIMPGLDGVNLAKRIRTIHPNVAVLFMSGYARGILSARSELQEDMLYLPKPFGLPLLARTVRVALDGR